jgi:dipeptidyl aminopeptidase/acylaminoacyl peptidase
MTHVLRLPALALATLGAACSGSSSSSTATAPAPIPDQPAEPTADAEEEPTYVAVGHPSQDLIPRTTFFGDPDRAAVQISPDGKQLSWMAESKGVLNVWVAPIGDLEKARVITSETERPVASYFWAFTNDHIIYGQDSGGDENWRVFSVEIDSGKRIDITPSDKKVQARILKVSHLSPKRVVIGVNDRNPQLHDLYVVDVTTGAKELLLENPGFVGFEVDHKLQVQLGTRMTEDGGAEMMKPPKKTAKAMKAAKQPATGEEAADPMAGWQTFMTIPAEDSLTTHILGFDKTGANAYMWDSRDRNTSALRRINMRSGKGPVIAEHPKADGSEIIVHPVTRKILAVAFTHARREWKVLDRSIQRDLDAIAKIADGEANVIDSTLDMSTWVLAFEVDDGPVRYYLWDRKAKKDKSRFLFTNRKALEAVKLAKMHPVTVKTRDGLELVNYLSLPPGTDPEADGVPAQPMPMVMLVHGGPWGRDFWGYNPLHQLLASRGYAVLAVNFRGSTGFGKEFINAGNFEWGRKMHDDLIDSVNWAVKSKVAAEDNICIMGGSYGGYATLVGLTATPDVFACGVDIVGPSNIISLLEAIPPYWKPLQVIFKTRVGDWTKPDGKAMLQERSPLSHVDKIVRPLLIGQGANDPRVKKVESDQIVAAMKSRSIPVSYVLFPDEGHGFRREPNQLAFWAATEAFLSAHLGGKYEPAEPEEMEGTTLQVEAGVHGIPGFPELMPKLAK